MSGPMGLFTYTSDNGNDYVVQLDASNALLGGGVATTGMPNTPRRMHLRYMLAQHPTTGRERRIQVCDPTNAHWTSDTPADVSLIDGATNLPVNYKIRGRIGERRFG